MPDREPTRARLTKQEKQMLVRAGNEVLAGEADGWTVKEFKALAAAVEKLTQAATKEEA